MALQAISGGLVVPHPPHNPMAANTGGGWGSVTIDAAGEKVAFLVTAPKTGNVQRVGFLLGAVTTAEDLKVSLQDIDLGTGDPDGAADQSVVVAAAGVVSNTWITATLSASRAVTRGQRFYVVIEFNLATGFVAVQTGGGQARPAFAQLCYSSHYTGSWTKQTTGNQPVVALEYDDGTYGPILGSYPMSLRGSTSFHNGSTPDEIALKFRFPAPVKIGGCWLAINMTNGAAADIVLYDSDGTTALETMSVDEDETTESGGMAGVCYFSQERTLAANTYYRLSLKPTNGTTTNLIWFDVAAAAILDAWDGGQGFHWSERTDAGAWTDTTTKRPMIGLIVTALDDGAGGGGVYTRCAQQVGL
jgi:hypothetical protein